ncbi:MAG: S-layer homology domain-containing protein [Candidatus Peribacteraceae bacterium]
MIALRSMLMFLFICSVIVSPGTAFATGIFSDVPDTHPYKLKIESLARAGIVKGDPNGNFVADRSLNRAEILKLLYTAAGKTAVASNGGCFSDVPRGIWFEAYVCDAAAMKYVQGYSDGKFRPGSPVTRTEALKMIHTVFGLPVSEFTEADRGLIKFVDISVSAWYTKYISQAYKNGILPMGIETGSRFYPDKELLRGEMAAMVYNGLNALKNISSSASSASSTSSTAAIEDDVRTMPFPFSDNGKFNGKRSIAYVFSTKEARTMIQAEVSITGFYSSDVTCRLYRLDDSGFSSEYYLGIQKMNNCIVAAAVPAGKYQLQIQPTVSDVAYAVTTKTVTSDVNDGFMDAIWLSPTTPRTGVLEGNDIADWYSFTVTKQMKGMITTTGTSTLNCIIYTPLSVDQYGFVGPECNKEYDFQPGQSYMVGVGRIGATDLAKTVTYTVKWQ